MRLATVYDKLSNEPRPVFELPGGQRVELRELFRAESPSTLPPDAAGTDAADEELAEVPMYFTDLAKTVEFLDDVIDAVRQWSRQQSDRTDARVSRAVRRVLTRCRSYRPCRSYATSASSMRSNNTPKRGGRDSI